VDHVRDPGGATNLGITIGTAKANRLDLDRDGDVDKADVRLITPATAAPVYKAKYWDAVRGDELPSGLDYAVFDFAVNSGVSRAAIFLQDLVGVAPDGRIGPLTLKAVAQHKPEDLIRRLCDKRMMFLQRLSTWNTFGKGWTSRVNGVRKEALAFATVQSVPVPPQKPVQTPPKPVSEAKPAPAAKSSPWTALIDALVRIFTRAK
jgi:lysozyme family protein